MKKTLILGALFVCCVCWVPQSMADVDSPVKKETSSDPSESAPRKFIDVKPIEEIKMDDFEEFFGRTVDEIRISGTRRTKDKTILRELSTKVGEPLLKSNLLLDYRRLNNLGIFSESRPYITEEGDRLILNLAVKETFAFLPSISMQINDENGFSIGGGVRALNLGGRAIRGGARVLVGGATTINATLQDPWLFGYYGGYHLEFDMLRRRNELFEFHENAYEGRLTISSYLKRHGRLGGRFSFQSIESDTDGRTLSENNRDDVATAELFLGYDSRYPVDTPLKGLFTNISLAKTGIFGSDGDFWQAQLDARGYVSLAPRHHLAVFSLTTLRTGEVGSEIAPWQQFGLGGTNSVRGWELGSRIGKNQFINTAEYLFTIVPSKSVTFFSKFTIFFAMQMALFGDLGSAWDDNSEFEESFISGGGVGLRFLVPYAGELRLDLGFGQPGVGIRFHLGGQSKPEKQLQRVR